MSIGSRIKYFAKENFGSINALADVMIISPNMLSQYVNDRSKPGADILIKLHKAGCDINWLLTGEITDNLNIIQENKELREKLETIKKVLNNG